MASVSDAVIEEVIVAALPTSIVGAKLKILAPTPDVHKSAESNNFELNQGQPENLFDTVHIIRAI